MDAQAELVVKRLKSEGSSWEIRTCIEALIDVHRKLKINPEEDKFRRIRCNNPAFFKKIGRFASARRFLEVSGWQKMKDASGEEILVFPRNRSADVPLDILVAHRVVTPSVAEEKRLVGVVSLTAKEERENELRRKAAIERDKELAACLKDKKEREELSRIVKAEHRADRARVAERAGSFAKKK